MVISTLSLEIEDLTRQVYGSQTAPAEIDFRGYAERGCSPTDAYRDASRGLIKASTQRERLYTLGNKTGEAIKQSESAGGYFARFANLLTGKLDDGRRESGELQFNLKILEDGLDSKRELVETEYREAEEMVAELARRKIDAVSAVYRKVRELENCLNREIDTSYGPNKLRKIREIGTDYSKNILEKENDRSIKDAEAFASELDDLLGLRYSESLEGMRNKLVHRIERYKALKTTLDSVVERAARYAESLIPEKEAQQAPVTDVRKYVESGIMFVHSVLIDPNDGYLNNKTGTNHRNSSWIELIENVITKRPHISTSRSRIFESDDLWSPVGVVINGGTVTYTDTSEGSYGATVAQPSGERTPLLDIKWHEVVYPHGRHPLDNEVAVRNPQVAGLYVDTNLVTHFVTRTVHELAQKYGLPVYKMDKKGHLRYPDKD